MELYPLKFFPIPKERIWGGRRLEQLFGNQLPPGMRIGEIWEISDRPEGQSIVREGRLKGLGLQELMHRFKEALIGRAWDAAGRFPLLVKVIDAYEILSLQVHPSEQVAARLGGEPKTEMWYIVWADAEAYLLAGLRRGVTRDEFVRRLYDGTVGECVWKIKVRIRDSMFVPAGRVHAIGPGVVLFEVQQNSDTTYRVFDWNRVDHDGRARPLHIDAAIQSIDFNDYEPQPYLGPIEEADPVERRLLVPPNQYFSAWEVKFIRSGFFEQGTDELPWIVASVQGELEVRCATSDFVRVRVGEFVLIPAAARHIVLKGAVSTLAFLACANPCYDQSKAVRSSRDR